MPDRVPLLLVGCGLMGARHLRGHAELERVRPGSLELVAVCDPAADRAAAVADEAAELLGRRPAVYTDLTQAAADSGAVAADVVTPNRTHDAAVLPLFAAGIHVLLEKPFTVTIERGQRILAAARAAEVVLGVAENNRRDPMNRLCRAVVDAGLLGPLNCVQVVNIMRGGKVLGTPWRHHLAMGGLPLDVALHVGYIVEYLAGEIAEVAAAGGLVETVRSWTGPTGETGEVACEGHDAVSASLRFAGGAWGTWTMHFASSGATRYDRLLIGAAGSLEAPGDRGGKSPVVRLGDRALTGDELVAELPAYQLNPLETSLFGERPASYELTSPETDCKLLAAEVGDFLDAVSSGGEPEVPGELGLRSVALIYALLESVKAAAPVRVEDVLAGRVRAYQDEVEAAG